MIDLHTHILYDVDDGSDSIETSYQMLFQAIKNEGIEHICLTPHFSKTLLKEYDEKMSKLNDFANVIGLKLYKGCEYHYSDLSVIDDYLTINDSGYLLVDFASNYIPPNTLDVFFELEIKSLRIVLAHPERLFSEENLDQLLKFQDAGIYFQLNASSLLGYNGNTVRHFAHSLIESGLCHLIASDTHNMRSRKFYMRRCYEYISNYYYEDIAHVLFYENPLRILRGEALIQLDNDAQKSIFHKLLRKYFRYY